MTKSDGEIFEDLKEELIDSVTRLTNTELSHLVSLAKGTSSFPGKEKKFSHSAYDSLLQDTVEKIQSLSKIKGGEYAVVGDRLDNFRRAALDQGLSMESVWRTYAAKHWDSISTYVKDINMGITRPRSEPILGRADDLIVYLILFKAMCLERDMK